MMSADQVEQRLNFALNSPDFWRGLIIALAVLTIAMLARVLILALKSGKVIPTASNKWTQVAGIISYGLLVVTSAGAAFDRLGNLDFSWRLVSSAIALILAVVWAVGSLNVHPSWMRRKRKDDE